MPEIPSQLVEALADRYRISRVVGEGGMATVYLAEDLKHQRLVALKVLRPELAAVVGAERFVAEIRTTANLQHPHILPLFDSGESAGFVWYVMPYVEGDTLADRLAREKQLPVDEAVQIAVKVAGALQAAHDRGIIHRDIKPANILMGERGEPLVADFGIALAVQEAGGGRLTETGLSLGTPHYMSPEQATADRELDARSDIYALGCVLYQMLTGEPPFGGGTAQAVLGRILTADPQPPTEVRRSVPPNVDAAILQALEKTPADRPASADGFARALQDPSFVGSRPAASRGQDLRRADSPSSARIFSSGPLPWVLTGIMAVLTAFSWFAGSPLPADSAPAYLEVPLPLETSEDSASQRVRISPDGRSFYTQSAGQPIRIRAMSAPQWRTVQGTEGHWPDTHAAISPDGSWLAFVDTDFSLRVVPTAGGTPRVLVEGTGEPIWEPTWDGNDAVVFARETGLFRIPVSGGALETLLSQEWLVAHPWVLPDGRGILLENAAAGSLLYLAPGADSPRVILQEARRPAYLPSGHLIFSQYEDGLAAARFDPDRGEVTSDVISLAEGIPRDGWSISTGGTLAFHSRSVRSMFLASVPTQLVLVGRDGIVLDTLPIPPGPHLLVRASPDGERVSFTNQTRSGTVSEVLVYDIARRAGPTSVYRGDGIMLPPAWSPDGTRMAVGTFNGTMDRGILLDVESGDVEALPDRPLGQQFSDWSRDGFLVGTEEGASERPDLLVVPVAQPDSAFRLVRTPFSEGNPRVSPDGRWVAFVSDESGQDEIHVRAFPDGSNPSQLTRGGALAPAWSPDGRQLFYARVVLGLPDDTIMVADFDPAGPTLSGDRPVIALDHWAFDVLPDGGLVVAEGVSEEALSAARGLERSIVVIVNWLESVRDILPD